MEGGEGSEEIDAVVKLNKNYNLKKWALKSDCCIKRLEINILWGLVSVISAEF